jgi:hypothetical protein
MSEPYRIGTVMLGDGKGKFLPVGKHTEERLRHFLEVSQMIVREKDRMNNGRHSFSTAEVRDARTRITAISRELQRRERV